MRDSSTVHLGRGQLNDGNRVDGGELDFNHRRHYLLFHRRREVYLDPIFTIRDASDARESILVSFSFN